MGRILPKERIMSDKKSSKSVKAMADKVKAAASVVTDKDKPQPWMLRLNEKQSQILNSYIENKVAGQSFYEKVDLYKPEVLQYCYNGYLKRWFEDKAKPTNPVVQTLDENGNVNNQLLFICYDKFNINIDLPAEEKDYNNDWAHKAAVKSLEEAGLSKSRANKFVELEVECLLTTHFLSLEEMMDGRTASNRKKIPPTTITQEAARKLMLFMNWTGRSKKIEPLSQDEIASITYNKLSWVPKAGVMERIFNYAFSFDDMTAILKVFSPVLSIRNEDCGVNLGEENRIKRLAQVAKANFQ